MWNKDVISNTSKKKIQGKAPMSRRNENKNSTLNIFLVDTGLQAVCIQQIAMAFCLLSLELAGNLLLGPWLPTLGSRKNENKNSTLNNIWLLSLCKLYVYNKCHGFLLSLELSGKLLSGPWVPILGSLTVAVRQHLEFTHFPSPKLQRL
jgi:hypothetical protein